MNSRRNFLVGVGAAALAPKALSAVLPESGASAPLVPFGDGQYVVGTTSNLQLPGPLAALVLNTWLSVAADGTGFGILTDRYDVGFASHLTVQSSVRHGRRLSWHGIVARSNEARLVGQPFTLSAVAAGRDASLALAFLGATFDGRGVVTQ